MHWTLDSPLQGTVLRVNAAPGALLGTGDPVVVLESMKMEHLVEAPRPGRVVEVAVAPGDPVEQGQALAVLRHPSTEPGEPVPEGGEGAEPAAETDPDGPPHGSPDGPSQRRSRRDLLRRRALLTDAARPEATRRRHERGQRTARENIADLCDPGSFEEYGGLAVAAQRARRSEEELQRRTPADGLIAGIGRVNGADHPDDRARCMVLAYDFTVLAGTQGQVNHRKKDRMFELARRLRLPVVIFAEGGGGRPGDTDTDVVTGLDTTAFAAFGGLSGLVPLVGVVSGRCFAGNAVLLGSCDVVIATSGSNIGMGGPAMIEGGGLGRYRPEDIGPLDVQVANGVVDVAVTDEAEAVQVARRYLSFFQGAVRSWEAPDQTALDGLLPDDRRRAYDVRQVVEGLFDAGSVLELRAGYARNMVTALARLEGRPVGVLANDPSHLAGAVDADAADKASRFLQLCDAHGLPVVSLCDTPGFLVGPEAEQEGLVRRAARLFVVGGTLEVPVLTVVLRRGYGLGAQAMAGGSFRSPVLTVAWDRGELGGMGLEGAVRLGFRRELEAAGDEAERRRLFDRLVAAAYEHGSASNVASHFEIDDVILPEETRRRLVEALRAVPAEPPRARRRTVDPW